MPSRITRKSTRPRVADRTMVDTRTTTSACQFQKPIGVVATNEHAAAEVERSKTRNHRARHKTRASLLSDKGLDAANHNPRFRRREKNVLDIPSYRTGVSAHNPVSECFYEKVIKVKADVAAL